MGILKSVNKDKLRGNGIIVQSQIYDGRIVKEVFKKKKSIR